MFDDLSAPDLALRLGAALLAGAVLGFDRSERGRAAGIRTMMLVTLAAAIAMIDATLWLGVTGRDSDSFVRIDVFRLPLGILTGIGFIGAGAIVKRGDMIAGVSTAAALWLATVIGLCIGGGQIGLGLAGTVLGFLILSAVKPLESMVKRDQHARLVVVGAETGPSEQDLRTSIRDAGYSIVNSASTLTGERREFSSHVQWRSRTTDEPTPAFVQALVARPGVLEVSWRPISFSTH